MTWPSGKAYLVLNASGKKVLNGKKIKKGTEPTSSDVGWQAAVAAPPSPVHPFNFWCPASFRR